MAAVTAAHVALLRRVHATCRNEVPYFTLEAEADDMAFLLANDLVEGDATEVEITEFGVALLENL